MGDNSTLGSGISSTSPKSVKQGTTVLITSDVIPIIFIPGIMGSNIQDKRGNKVWDLPNTSTVSGYGSGMAVYDILSNRWTKTPKQLQEELDPKNTKVDRRGHISVDSQLGLSEKTLRDRGWGTVHWDSYGKILTYLQLHLNNIAFEKPSPPKMNKTFGDAMDMQAERVLHAKKLEQYNKSTAYIDNWNSILNSDEHKKWNALIQPLAALTRENINNLRKFSFPVYALGYNWLQSNKDSAVIISNDLVKIKSDLGSSFRKFIIISHSMGGLVTRELVKTRGDDIAGVVHGVMPADGAAAAYRRIVAGSWEGKNKVTQALDWIAANVMGRHTESVTAVLANAPGGLELLPNSQYNSKKPWLFLTGKDASGNLQKIGYPKKGDPYEEIYKKHGVWWEMVKEELLDPAKKIPNKPGELKKKEYFKKIDQVKTFHNGIINSFHPYTYLHWGNNKKNSFAALTWMLSQNLTGMSAQQLATLPRATNQDISVAKKIELSGTRCNVDGKKIAAENDGIRYITLKGGKLAHFSISMQDANGDGTVPAISGGSPFQQDNKSLKQVFPITGFGHQDSYQNINVQRSVLYSIVSIIKDNNIQPKNR